MKRHKKLFFERELLSDGNYSKQANESQFMLHSSHMKSDTPVPAPHPPATPTPQVPAQDPGQIYGILSLITIPLSLTLIGVILGYIGMRKSKAAGYDGTLSKIGLIICAVLTILGLIAIILVFVLLGGLFFEVFQKCQELGPGEHIINGATYTCNR